MMNTMSTIEQHVQLLELQAVSRTFPGGFRALAPTSLALAAGDFVAVVGRSGSGKSTLLHLAAGLDRPSGGAVLAGGARVDRLGERELAAWRGRTVGVVFQFFQLLPTLSILDNVLLPMDFLGALPPAAARARARSLLEAVGIPEQAHKLPSALSGGQQQRAALARALANDPPLLMADEPTGNLDSRAAAEVMALLAAQAEAGKAVLLVTHERELHPRVDRVLTLVDGQVAASAAARAS